MTKEQLFEELDFEHGDKIHVIIGKKIRKDGIERNFDIRINYGFNIYELFGMFSRLLIDINKTFTTKDDSDVQVKKISLCDDKEIKLGDSVDDLNELAYSTNEIKDKFDDFIKNQKDIPQKYIDIINKHFWDLI